MSPSLLDHYRWWLGGFLQSVFICAPFLYLFSTKLLQIRDKLITKNIEEIDNRSKIKFAIIVVISIIILYVWIAFQINILNIEDKLMLVLQDDIRNDILKATQVINFPVIVFIFIIMFLGYFFFYFTDYWTLRLQGLNNELLNANTKLTEKNERLYFNSIHDTQTGFFNRTYLFQKLPIHFNEAKLSNTSLTIFMLDLDRFKLINMAVHCFPVSRFQFSRFENLMT